MKFSDVIGQTSLKSQLIKSAAGGRVPHAQLFLGGEGTGNLALALAYAQYIHCTDKQAGDSCGVCSSCSKHQGMIHPDMHFTFPFPSSKADIASELYGEWRAAVLQNPYLNYEAWMQALAADNKQGNIPVKECRAIIKNLSLKAFEGEYKILVMWLPEYLGVEGNVLLKLIEEPAHKTLFLLVALEADKILTTILSRTQMVRIPPLDVDSVSAALQVKYNLSKEEGNRIGLMSGGNYLRACELAEQAENEYLDPFRNWLRLCYTRNMTGIMQWVDSYASTGREQLKGFFIYSLEILRAAMARKYVEGFTGLSREEEEFSIKLADVVKTHAQAELMYQLFNDAAYEIQRNGNARLILTDLSFKLVRIIRKN